MNKKIIKMISIFVLAVFLCAICSNVLAAVSDFSGATTGFGGGDAKIKKIINAILSLVRNIGVGIAVIILMSLGCKYMMASAGERAEIKKYAITYIIGAVVLFASSTLIGIIQKFALNVYNAN